MSDQHDNGGQAYPMNTLRDENGNVVKYAAYGMTLWDHYYGLSMQSLIIGDELKCDKAASLAADYADAMIAERNRRIGR